MQSDWIAHSVAHPESLDEAGTSKLEELTRAYPWFSAGQILLAKAYHNTGNLQYDDQLHLAAIYAGSRSVIYDLIIAHEVATDDGLVDARKEAVLEQEPAIEHAGIVDEKVEELEAEAEAEVETEALAAAESGTETETETKPEAFAETETETGTEGGKEKPEALVEMEQTIIAGAVSAVIEQEVGEEVGNDPQPQAEAAEPQTPEETAEPLSGFAAWVLKRSRETGYIPEDAKEPGTPQEPVQPLAEHTFEAPTSLKKQRDLIDAFIASDPKITPGKVSEYSTEDIAKASLAEDDTWITETMAQLYARQGKLGKARKAYEMLALKYPEKSIYFANQLKKLARKK